MRAQGACRGGGAWRAAQQRRGAGGVGGAGAVGACAGGAAGADELRGAERGGARAGLVVDVGHGRTDVAAVVDAHVLRASALSLPLGGRVVREHLRALLADDPLFVCALPLDDALLDALLHSGLCRLFNAKERTRPPLVAAIKRVEWVYQGHKPSLAGLDVVGIAEAAYLVAMNSLEPLDKRFALWDSVLITGGLSVVPGLHDRFENEMLGFLAASETSNEFQVKDVKFAKIPEYLSSAYKEPSPNAAFLGATITARLTLNTPGMHITKNDYNEMGPSVYRFK
ncbi:general RNA polymerase II transcription factor [Physocladia obscura]|uniref:General RNA polymerase II transcription factor n=1 Tax=Physocladia obscura TaxID=109957 RepID=A0AAD5T3L5_9FUNG|nr:general RNA polymerase II transcription factor [Physocladia obscura]